MRRIRIFLKKIVAVGLILLHILLFSGCETTVECYGDELKANRFEAVLKSGYKVSLEFEENNAAFEINGDKVGSKISGVSIVSEDTFVICDEKTKETYAFSYALTGDKLTLTYDGFELVLQKVSDSKNKEVEKMPYG